MTFALILPYFNGIIFLMENVLIVENLSVSAYFFRSTEKIVDGVSFCLGEGERLAIVGESGSGKSMIVNAITSSLADNCFALGKILFNGDDLLSKKGKKYLGKEIVFVPQGGAESLNPCLKIKTQIYEALPKEKRKLSREEKRAYALHNLERAGLKNGEEILEKYPFEVSGGEAQRVVLAIAMCVKPTLIVADEMTRGIDREAIDVFWDCIDRDFATSSLIVVTHDMSVASRCDKVLVLKEGKLQEYGKTEEVFLSPKNEYTKSLILASESSYA